MDDLGAMLNQFLSSREGQEQLQAVASALGNQGGGAPQAAPAGNSGGGQIDIASLLAGLQSGGQTVPSPAPSPQPAQASQGGGLDLTQLGQMLSGLQAPASTPTADAGQGSGLNLGALAGLLGNPNTGGGPAPSANPLPGLDLGAIMNLQQAFSTFSQTDRNVDVLLSIKPHLSPERAKKADDAVRILQLIKLLPLIKDTGLFGDMSWLGGGGTQ